MADANMISPGVYTRIIDLTNYASSVSGTIGFVPVITEKGKDNELVRITSYQDYIEQFGEPDIRTFGKYYGCGPYIATQHLSVSSDLYVLRALPDDATYAHTFIYFSQVDDYPYAYKFAQRYQDQICDAGKIVKTKLYKVADGSQTTIGDKRSQAIQESSAYDAELQNTKILDAVIYTSDTKLAAMPDTAKKLWAIDKVSEGWENKLAELCYIPGVEVYDQDYNKIEILMDITDENWPEFFENLKIKAIWTTKETEGVPATDFIYDATQYVAVKEREGEWEPTSSNGDFNVGYSKSLYCGDPQKWYSKKHTGLSAFSIIPGLVYGVQSDVTCYQQVGNKAGSPCKVDPAKKLQAVQARAGYGADGLIILDTNKSDDVVSVPVDRKEFALLDDVGQVIPVEGTIYIPSWEVDKEPWYKIDPNKVKEAIDAYDAYDTFGWLTNDETKAVYCAYKSNSLDGETETVQALRRPLTKKFVVDSDNLLYTMDRKVAGWENNALKAIRSFAAWDQNGYPALSVDKVYVTSIEEYAVTAKAPKMNNTQMLDSVFYGNDTLILASIANLGELQPQIYSKNNRIPSKCVLGSVRAVGRGDYYNTYSIKITSDANPQAFGTYKFHVYELQDGAEVLVETFNVSFDPTALDGDGESLYFVDVINKFSTRIVITANENAVELFNQEMREFYLNDPTITDLTTDYVNVDADGNAQPFNTAMIPTFVSDETDDNYDKIVNADMTGNLTGGVEKAAQFYFLEDGTKVANEFGYKAKAIWEAYYAKAWAEKYTFDAAKAYNEALELPDTDEGKAIALDAAIVMMNVAQDMTADASEIYSWATSLNLMNMSDSDSISAGQQPFYLENGSLGGLINDKGAVVASIGNQILAQAYTGLLKKPVIVKKVDETTGAISYRQKYTDDVYNTEWVYFSLVYDPGYKPDVKQAALDLVDTYRRDCVLISDCCDNADCEDCLKYVGAVLGGSEVRSWNTYLAARYEPYSRVYDTFTGKDMWVSPVYHMAKMIPSVDVNYGMQFAAAGFNRGTISDIKELRYSPNKSQRDSLYTAQVNPIVYFPEGMTMWGQLTTQKKQTVLSDLNSVRVVLYIKRALEQYCRNFIFETNDSQTWDSISARCGTFLTQMISNNMISSYTCDVGATDYELKTKTCHVNVTLTMKKTLEKIQLNLYIQ